MDDVVIKVSNLSKSFNLSRRGNLTLKAMAMDCVNKLQGKTDPTRLLWALKNVSFEVKQGEVLGLIGANGAGKSTLLGLLAGTMAPSSGSISTCGSMSSLLELGAGFHPDLTGKENIFLAGATMGLSRRQMSDRLDAIVDFAGLAAFIDQPVKHYSSGMYVRLGFAVAVEVNPDILLIDEVLAVGDAAFQRKCMRRMEEFRRLKKTMLIISHDLNAIQTVSTRILFLDGGEIKGDGAPAEIVNAYESFWRRKNSTEFLREWGTREVILESVEFRDAADQETDQFEWGQPLCARIHYRAAHRIEKPVFGFAISDSAGRIVYGNNTQIENHLIPSIEGVGEIRLTFPRLNLAKGTYLFSFSVHSDDHQINYHRLDHAFPIAVESARRFEGLCHIPCVWSSTPEVS
jgi:ABC-type polysaccharide/polyol phosphate transport system ATPase subunit